MIINRVFNKLQHPKTCRFMPKTLRWRWCSEVTKQRGFSVGLVHNNNTTTLSRHYFVVSFKCWMNEEITSLRVQDIIGGILKYLANLQQDYVKFTASRCKKSLYLLSYLLSTSGVLVEAQTVAQVSCSSWSTTVGDSPTEIWSEIVYQSVADTSDSTSSYNNLVIDRKHLDKNVKPQTCYN